MHRNPDGSRLVGDCPRNCLTNPPCRICGKFESLSAVEFFDSLNKTQVTFLNQIQKKHTAAHISFCNADNKTQIRLREFLLRFLVSHFHPLRQFNFLFRAQKRHFADFLQIHSDRVFDADAVRHGQVNIFHIHIVFFRQNDFLVIYIVSVRNPQNIYIILFQCFQNPVKLLFFQRYIMEKFADFLVFQNILFLFSNI